ncbi:2,3-bisphosphoglycerate-dependent phosphoglycerate mutase [Cladophialophora psammophila CBS 110553]|uniref:2,3-bisphosphoglycerate-dependent phosphoglycerate mutase n=1 Tax=Cladophialophora psammophila CBS 110553 TaxID=1182543 RepID=W9WN56_9EURO|nr:2,3-bisphosphoglycerate-dependent phosphoglycerate mutase [Cladophialophora psammophila CBS 110553]EXJ69627.1 2,3-bisphosphoglycerate-dependent phosphoglycerate mutase [Cladophialophora psammophila CBS 110553]
MTTPRCFIVRHGETEWSLSGKHTGTTDIPLTKDGEKRVRTTGKALVGDDRLIVPKQLVHIYVSPRHRAQRTLELLSLGCQEPYPWQQSQSKPNDHEPLHRTNAPVTVDPRIAEWDYGDYEGITSAEIRALRKEQGLGPWDIWRDGCPGGESPQDIINRIDDLIREIREKYHCKVIGKPKQPGVTGDVLVVGHGHILRAFAVRWIGRPLTETAMIMEAGGVGTLSYEHHNIHEPAILLGGGFVVGDDKDEIEKGQKEGNEGNS